MLFAYHDDESLTGFLVSRAAVVLEMYSKTVCHILLSYPLNLVRYEKCLPLTHCARARSSIGCEIDAIQLVLNKTMLLLYNTYRKVPLLEAGFLEGGSYRKMRLHIVNKQLSFLASLAFGARALGIVFFVNSESTRMLVLSSIDW